MPLEPVFGEKTIDDIILKFKHRQINLEPGFQRKSVWTNTDRTHLIQSIVRNYPLPNVFLYERQQDGHLIYDVIDGKQRLETILMFTRIGRFKRDWFSAKLDIGDDLEWYDWKTLPSDIRARFLSYKIQTVEIKGDLNEIVDVFVRINSTGKRLTSGEKRHAKYYRNAFLKEAERLVTRFRNYLLDQRILSPAQIDRMKGTELFSELLMSLHKGSPINKKTALDRAIGNENINGNTLNRLSREFVATIRQVKKMFPELKQTRFHHTADFYSLFLLVWQMRMEDFILTDRGKNKLAFVILRKLSTEVDKLRESYRNVKGTKPRAPYSDYLLTVRADTDSSATRERRAHILESLLRPIFARKDEQRFFSPEQRRIIWDSEQERRCSNCHKRLTFDDFTIDHIIAYAKGGKTDRKNAALMCRKCNSRKGAN
jgi:5-methylcytosine-specific restriction endonuclease McrA